MVVPKPDPALGLRQAAALWKLVLVVWLASVAVLVPFRIVVWTAVWTAVASLPDGGLPEGELLLILVERLRPVAAPAVVALVSAWLALWAWTVLWHAGLVRWFVYSGRTGVRLAEILSRGLFGWWRWARLGLTSGAVLAGGASVLAWGVDRAVDRAAAAGSDRLLGALVVSVLVAAPVLVLGCWLATLRGAWLLGDSRRRSAVLAFIGGLAGAVRRPLTTLSTFLLWAVPAVAAMLVPLVLGWRLEAMRGVAAAAVIDAATGLVAAFCWVALFLSFAPVAGLGRDASSDG